MLAVTGSRLIDGSYPGEPLEDAVVLIDDETIVAVGRRRDVPMPSGATVIDLEGATLLPGLIDCHVHGTYRSRDIQQHLLDPPSYNTLRSTDILRRTLSAGVTTARDLGGADAGFKRAIAEGLIAGPDLLVAIGMISQTGGHGDAWLPAELRLKKRAWLPDLIADGPDEVRRAAREVLMRGADVVKVCASGGITSVTDNFDESQYTVEEMAAAVYEANCRNKVVASHAESVEGIKNSLRAGVHTIEHGWFMDEEAIELMLEGGAWWVPTLALVPRGLERRKEESAWSEQALAPEAAKEEEIDRLQQRQIPIWREAVARGVNVAMGSDQSHRLLVGENLVELEYMVERLGMDPLQAIDAATATAARCLRLSDRGRLAEGYRADLVAVDGDCAEDVAVLGDPRNLRAVVRGGVPVDGLPHDAAQGREPPGAAQELGPRSRTGPQEAD